MKVLIIGLGSIAQKHIDALRQVVEHIEIYALRSSFGTTNNEGVFNLYSWDELAQYQFDFVIISNPTSEHVSTIKRINESTSQLLPLFIEKPLDNEIVDDSFIKCIQAKGQVTYVACNLRFLDCIGQLKKILKGKRINEVNVYCGSYLPDWRLGSDFRKVYSAIPELGGGVHLDLIHELDYVYYLFGRPHTTQSIKSSKSSLDIRSVDYAHYLFEYEGFYANLELNYYRRDSKRTIEVVCEDETYLADLLKNSIYLNGEKIYSSTQRIVDTYNNQIVYYIRCLNEGCRPHNDIEEANEILKICLK